MDFPGGPVLKTVSFHCRGLRFDTWSGKLNMWSKKPKTEQDRTAKAGEGTDQTGEEEATDESAESKSSSSEYYTATTDAGALRSQRIFHQFHFILKVQQT